MNIIVLFIWFSTMWMIILLTWTDLLDSILTMPFVIDFLSVCDWGMGMISGIIVVHIFRYVSTAYTVFALNYVTIVYIY